MFKIKLLIFIIIAFSPISNYAQFTDVINSNRPGKSMAAFSVGKTVFQTEFGVNYTNEKYDDADYKSDIWSSDLVLRYGVFFEQLEAIASIDYQNEKYSLGNFDDQVSGLRKITLGGKFLVYDPVKNYEEKPNLYSWKANHKFNYRQFIPAVAVYGGVNANISNNRFTRLGETKETDFTLKGMVITQNQFGRYTFLTNFILDQFPANGISVDYIITLTRGFNSRVSGLLEFQGMNNDFDKGHYWRLGGAYLLKQNLQIDGSFGTNFDKAPAIAYAGVGLSWRFDKNYSEVMLRIPKEEKNDGKSKKDKDKEKKEKDKKKKRLDAIESTPVNP